ncbi:hypothetical protein [Neisseria weaveri]|uniref:hypothetical protein n=1 Tax=Neisseria weaveri TaxID=28091 RepID=UPI0002231A26|nr:hypothetical protein [Neisseria weaveri]EGV38484.1 hypothetical protein l13_00170 [Neisseria weaveri ATCC 51223]
MEIKRQIEELSPNNKIILREIVLENARNGRVFGHLELELLIICLLETEDGQKGGDQTRRYIHARVIPNGLEAP